MEKSIWLKALTSKKFLTLKEQKIIKYLQDYSDNIDKITIMQVAKGTGSGMSVIYRLMKKLGYVSFRSFVFDLSSHIQEIKNLDPRYRKDILVLDYYLEIIAKNQRQFDELKLEKTVQYILTSNKIGFFCLDSANHAVKALSDRLVKFGYASQKLSNNLSEAIYQVKMMTKNDLLFIIVSEKTTYWAEFICKAAKSNDINIILITTNFDSYLIDYAKITHYIISSSVSTIFEAKISTLLPIIYFGDYLIHLLLKVDDKDNKFQELQNINKYRNDLF